MSDERERIETLEQLVAWAKLAAPRSRWRLRRSQFPDRFVLEHSGIDLPLSEVLYNHIRAAWTAAYGSSFGSRSPRAILALLDADAAARVRQAQGGAGTAG